MTESKQRSRSKIIWITLGIVAIAAVLAVLVLRPFGSASVEPSGQWAVVPVRQQPMVAQVIASGVVAPEGQAALDFGVNGLVSEILVDVGDEVTQGQVLARLQNADLHVELRRAEASVAQAQANRDKLLIGATPEDIAAAQAQIAAASGSLQQTVGNVTQADIDAAQAQVRQAQTALDKVLSGPRSADVQASQAQLNSALSQKAIAESQKESAQAQLDAAQAQLDAANASLEQSRTTLSATKTKANNDVDQAANVVRDRQAEYARIRDDNQRLRDAGIDPPQDALDAEAQALRAIQTAQDDLENARIAYDAAVQNEITGIDQAQAQVNQTKASVNQAQASVTQAQGQIDQAQAQVDQAQANLAGLTSPAEADQVAAAQANLANAQANLTKLTGGSRAGSVNAARGNVAAAQANLDKLQAAAQPADLAVAEAQIKSAEASRDLAQLQLERTELRAPFAGTIAAINLNLGESAPGAGAMTLVDLSTLHVNITVDEIDVARVQTGQPVSVTLDALSELSIDGVVRSVAPLATAEQGGATSYAVRVDLVDAPSNVKSGMSATAEIQTASKPNALVVPRRALSQNGQRTTVQVVTGEPTQPGARPPTREVQVQIGLSNEQNVEILSGLQVGDEVFVEGVSANFFEQGNNGPPGRPR